MSRDPSADTFIRGGEMGALIRSMDWASTVLGPMEQWPTSLRTVVGVVLENRFPMALWWGTERINLYNDAYRPILGDKHPRALGELAPRVWAEIWHIIGPMGQSILEGHPATWSEHLLLPMQRKGFIEETYFTFSYSPVPNDTGGVGGMLITCQETTEQVLSERRLRMLQDLAVRPTGARTPEQACLLGAQAFQQNLADLPFAHLYLLDETGLHARLVAAVGISVGTPGSAEDPWSLRAVASSGKAVLLRGLRARFGGSLPEGVPDAALVLPVARPGETRLAGILVAGLSPQLVFDEKYRSFLELTAGQVATAIANVSALREAERRAEALAELDRSKTVFFSNVSHEFRTPLTLMLGPLEDLLAGQQGVLTAAQHKQLELIHRSGLRLLKLVNTLLDFSRIEAGRANASYEATDLATLTAELASAYSSIMEQASLKLTVDCPPLPQPVWVDRQMWEKVVLNLLSNAFKFTFAGEIRVSLHIQGEQVALTVADTGSGIPPEELPRIFERFHRVQGAKGRSYEGSGIGLSLVQELVKLHGGTVRVESIPGQGTTFTVLIPTGQAHLPPERIQATKASTPTGMGTAAFLQESSGWLQSATPAPSAPEPDAAPAQGHILVADDNADMREYIQRLLEGRFSVETVKDGHAALAAARERPPDLVLSDVMMPGMDGFGLLQALRADPRTATIPVILLSARAGEEATVEGLKAGANDYLVKPFSARELLMRVEGNVKTARSRQDLDAFAGRIAHDLKNLLSPLALIGMKVKASRDERVQRAGGMLERLTQRANDVLDGMLAFARAGLAEEQESEVRLRGVINDVVEDVSNLRSQVDAELDTREVEDLGVALPRGLLYVILVNLLTNALKFMVDRPVRRVSVSARTNNGHCLLTVKDTGPGIAPEALPHIFEPFFRAPGASASGHGIGLATVQRILRASNGDVHVESTPGVGTTFQVRLPLVPRAAVAS
ncbi:ATP-binding protein [Hyalangium rubrum]|uniref:histidine kinase n=1 Tax=Hyalangium rubrum TaxID=3103134 RepID=A0ABU5GX85_9BACT|nr:ATP-binding protein [Hyalangium sp. s54d21]MDY7225800.1 ATP-binding protein [Hyalangium sp. s54d21]